MMPICLVGLGGGETKLAGFRFPRSRPFGTCQARFSRETQLGIGTKREAALVLGVRYEEGQILDPNYTNGNQLLCYYCVNV